MQSMNIHNLNNNKIKHEDTSITLVFQMNVILATYIFLLAKYDYEYSQFQFIYFYLF